MDIPTFKSSTVRGKELWQSLGFRNERAWYRARQAGWAEVRLYPLRGEKGVFARADELSAYLKKKLNSTPSNQKEL
jgi:hypothetical protein